MDSEKSTTSALGLVTLMALPGVGLRGAERLCQRFPTLNHFHLAIPAGLEGVINKGTADALLDPSVLDQAIGRARQVLETAEANGVRLITFLDPAYPEQLAGISTRPLVLYVKGTLPADSRFVACVGTRAPTEFGVKATERIASYLAAQGWSIVSGLALGVDTVAHSAALSAGGHTVAVLANGLDSIYPPQNARLADQILDAGGALISEQPFGVPATSYHLVARDRIQSGLARGTVVMQTDVSGGSMHTVRFTLLEGRPVFAPVSPKSVHGELQNNGTRALLEKTGAELASLIDAKGGYSKLLREKFSNRPVAIPIAGSADYPSIVEVLVKQEGGMVPSGLDPKGQLDLL